MIYNSTNLFLTNFCEPTECSGLGMEFLVDSNKVSCLNSSHHVWITVRADLSLRLLMVYEREIDLVEIESELMPMEASFGRLMQELQIMTRECHEVS